ncbi:retrovirus-related pol polyprotein from transposon TNT 1-94 [Tanacetum coccineum]
MEHYEVTRESEKNYDLDEDDYELLEDNGFRFSKVESKKFKRLKKQRLMMTDSTTDALLKMSNEEEEDGDTGKYEDEMADFFVNEEHMDEHGQPKRTYISAATRLSWLSTEIGRSYSTCLPRAFRPETLANTWILPLPYAQNIDAIIAPLFCLLLANFDFATALKLLKADKEIVKYSGIVWRETRKIRIQRYIRETNREAIRKSIQNGPTPHPMVTDPPPTGSTIVPGPRKKLDSEFNDEENKLEMADTTAEIIHSQVFPDTLFTYSNRQHCSRDLEQL